MSPGSDRWPAAAGGTAIGVAHGDFVEPLLAEEPGLVDFVEIPFELLLRNPAASRIAERVPVVLHCASLSLAGDVPPTAETLERLAAWAGKVETPWIGEHLAYIAATAPDPPAIAPGEPAPAFEVGYTVSPRYGADVLERVVASHARWEARLERPILMENSPLAFELPGAELSQFEFLRALCARLGRPRLLLDLSHLLLSCRNLGLDAEATLDELPVEAVVEVHIAGMREHDGLWWDDHARPAEPAIFALLERVLARVRPRAITFEYNWDGRFPRDVLRRQIAAVRELTARA